MAPSGSEQGAGEHGHTRERAGAPGDQLGNEAGALGEAGQDDARIRHTGLGGAGNGGGVGLEGPYHVRLIDLDWIEIAAGIPAALCGDREHVGDVVQAQALDDVQHHLRVLVATVNEHGHSPGVLERGPRQHRRDRQMGILAAAHASP